VQQNEHSLVICEPTPLPLLKRKTLATWLFGLLFAYCQRIVELLSQDWAWIMNRHIPDHVDEHRAAVLLGMPASELRRYSKISGLGHVETDEKGQKVVFTYEELRRICLLVAQSSK